VVERRRAAQRGAGTVLIAGVMVVVAMVAVVAIAVGGYDTAQRATSGAADLVALSGAAGYRNGGDACADAREAAKANAVELTACAVAGDALDFAVSVTVRRHGELLLGMSVDVTATSVAGHLQPSR
jgi:secretion/DNA translocation related TadE-like protein